MLFNLIIWFRLFFVISKNFNPLNISRCWCYPLYHPSYTIIITSWHDLVANGVVEYIDTMEEETVMLAMTPEELAEKGVCVCVHIFLGPCECILLNNTPFYYTYPISPLYSPHQTIHIHPISSPTSPCYISIHQGRHTAPHTPIVRFTLPWYWECVHQSSPSQITTNHPETLISLLWANKLWVGGCKVMGLVK